MNQNQPCEGYMPELVVCKLCGSPMGESTPYEAKGACGACVREMANMYSLFHSGRPSEEFAPDEYREAVRARYDDLAKKRIPDSVRWRIWDRDNFTCQDCGTRENLAVDHIHPESKGGDMSDDNLQTLCKSCNSRKGARI